MLLLFTHLFIRAGGGYISSTILIHIHLHITHVFSFFFVWIIHILIKILLLFNTNIVMINLPIILSLSMKTNFVDYNFIRKALLILLIFLDFV